VAQTIRREECNYCGSSNNLCFFLNQYGKETSKCRTPNCEYNLQKKSYTQHQEIEQPTSELITSGSYTDIPEWGISKETCEKYLYQSTDGMHICNVADIDNPNKIAGQKLRYLRDKEFAFQGSFNKSGLPGGHLISQVEIKDTLYICEGEKDAMALDQYYIAEPNQVAVSVLNGAGEQALDVLKKRVKLIEGFKKYIIIMDSTDTGPETAKQLAKLLPPGKTYIVTPRYKDVHEYVQFGKVDELKEDVENAKQFLPASIRKPSMESMRTPVPEGWKWPFPELNEYTRGVKPGKLSIILAGAKIGKSSFTKEAVKFLLDENRDLKVGVAYLEEELDATGQSFVAMDNNVPVYKLQENPNIITYEQYQESYDKYVESDRIHFLDASFMDLSGKDLIYNLTYLIEGLGCRLIVLDHVTMITYDMKGEQSERKDIDVLMKNLRQLVHKTGAHIMTVCQLKRPQFGKSWAEGREVQMTDARGSSAFEQLCDLMIALERDMNSEYDKGKTKVKVLANRVTGKTGYVDELHYIENTGRLQTKEQLFKR
jgi:twinkle protein